MTETLLQRLRRLNLEAEGGDVRAQSDLDALLQSHASPIVRALTLLPRAHDLAQRELHACIRIGKPNPSCLACNLQALTAHFRQRVD